MQHDLLAQQQQDPEAAAGLKSCMRMPLDCLLPILR